MKKLCGCEFKPGSWSLCSKHTAGLWKATAEGRGEEYLKKITPRHDK